MYVLKFINLPKEVYPSKNTNIENI